MSDDSTITGAGESEWVLVPREPTPEMLEAFWLSTGESREMRARTELTAIRRYDAMIAAAPSPDRAGDGGDLVGYLQRQWAWSKDTFGPALRTKGIVQHITKELREIEAEPHDLAEWVDVIILAMDGFWRHGGKPEDLLPAMQAKQDKNFARKWPDWRTMGDDQAIEHDRSGEIALAGETALAAETCKGSTGGESAADLSATPKHSPEPNPPMSVEEAADIVGKLPFEHNPAETVWLLRKEADKWIGRRRDDCLARASRIETALRTLSENGEAR